MTLLNCDRVYDVLQEHLDDLRQFVQVIGELP